MALVKAQCSVRTRDKSKPVEIEEKKSRKPNFSQSETAFVAEKYEEYKEIMDAAHKGSDTNKKKKETWDKIVTQHRARFPGVMRSVYDLRQKLSKLKTESREHVMLQKKSQTKTGGGKSVPEPSEAHKKIIELCEDTPSFQGLPGVESFCSSQTTSAVSGPEDIPDSETETIPSNPTESNDVPECPPSTSREGPRPPKIPRKSSFGDLVDLEKQNLLIKQQNMLLQQEKLKLEIELLKRKLNANIVSSSAKEYYQL